VHSVQAPSEGNGRSLDGFDVNYGISTLLPPSMNKNEISIERNAVLHLSQKINPLFLTHNVYNFHFAIKPKVRGKNLIQMEKIRGMN
jgi:hypothetical protein